MDLVFQSPTPVSLSPHSLSAPSREESRSEVRPLEESNSEYLFCEVSLVLDRVAASVLSGHMKDKENCLPMKA